MFGPTDAFNMEYIVPVSDLTPGGDVFHWLDADNFPDECVRARVSACVRPCLRASVRPCVCAVRASLRCSRCDDSIVSSVNFVRS